MSSAYKCDKCQILFGYKPLKEMEICSDLKEDKIAVKVYAVVQFYGDYCKTCVNEILTLPAQEKKIERRNI